MCGETNGTSQRYLEKYRAALTHTTDARMVEDRKGKRPELIRERLDENGCFR
jgi:hypothetical protein